MGIEIVRMADTRDLSSAARMLFDGVDVRQNGKKIRNTALDRLAKSLGMYSGKLED